MDNTAIRVENLSKQYRIGARQAGYNTIRETMTDLATAPLRRLRRLGQPTPPEESIWAVKDVSFEVERGEVVGIIGHNGAGKTTLLKILSRITEPTEGRAEILGRVGSLLEVGTGFHPELTGRENVYLNGAILGMKRVEIHRKFDEIVQFAEIEKFLDTPVKRYSSGMYVRLAFAVAAHLEPEILLVDEVLAVGDAGFQKKCLGKMGDVAHEGRTVLFVSHNMAAVERLCGKALWMHDGRPARFGPTPEAISAYERSAMGPPDSLMPGVPLDVTVNEGKKCYVTRVEILDQSNSPLETLHTGDTVVFRIHYRSEDRIRSAAFTLDFSTTTGIRALRLSSSPLSGVHIELAQGAGFVDCIIEWFPLAAGAYIVGIGIAIPRREWLRRVIDIGEISVNESDIYDSGLAPTYPGTLIATRHSWRHFHGEPRRGGASHLEKH